MSDTTLLTSVESSPVRLEGDDYTVTRISIGGVEHLAAIVNAVAANYHRLSGRQEPTEEQLRTRIGTRVTLIATGENMFGAGAIVAREGKLFEGSSGNLGILPKGARTKGYRVDVSKVLDFFDGYVPGHAAALVEQVRDHYPTLVNLTQERLEQLPDLSDSEERADMLTLAVFGTYTTGWGVTHDAIWLASEYWKEQDICENVLLVRPDFGVSEHGSCFGRQWHNRPVGEVVGFEPITFAEGIRLCNVDYDEALGQLFGGAREVAA